MDACSCLCLDSTADTLDRWRIETVHTAYDKTYISRSDDRLAPIAYDALVTFVFV